jgi:stage V sporulation protein AA
MIYLRMHHRLRIGTRSSPILLGEVCDVLLPESLSFIKKIEVASFTEQDGNYLIVHLMDVLKKIRESAEVEVQTIGPDKCLVEARKPAKPASKVALAFVWLLLFIGSGVAIMNFHMDVSMMEVHQKIYTLLTGKVAEHPLIVQIPYSIGIGLGMILFFNHVWKKKLSDEPSPLEVEVFLYQENMDQYLIQSEVENQKGRK